MTTTNEIIHTAASNLMEMFQTGKMPKAVAWTLIQKQKGDDSQPSYSWSIGNQILMLLQGTDDARGYKQWSDVGRYVKKGAKAIHILAPITKTIDDKDKPGEKKVILLGFRPIPVFRVEDTDGKPLLRSVYFPPVPPPFWDVAAYLGLAVEYTPAVAHYLGKFNRLSGKITLCAQDAFVYFHELAHAVDNDLFPAKYDDTARAEIVAEMTACVLCQLQQIEGYEEQAYHYIKHYCREKDAIGVVKAIMAVLNDVEQIVTKILTAAEEIDRQRQTKKSS